MSIMPPNLSANHLSADQAVITSWTPDPKLATPVFSFFPFVYDPPSPCSLTIRLPILRAKPCGRSLNLELV